MPVDVREEKYAKSGATRATRTQTASSKSKRPIRTKLVTGLRSPPASFYSAPLCTRVLCAAFAMPRKWRNARGRSGRFLRWWRSVGRYHGSAAPRRPLRARRAARHSLAAMTARCARRARVTRHEKPLGSNGERAPLLWSACAPATSATVAQGNQNTHTKHPPPSSPKTTLPCQPPHPTPTAVPDTATAKVLIATQTQI